MVPAQSRRERKKRQTNAAIVAAARELFVTRGYDNVTIPEIPEIAELAEVGASAVFVHFRSKDEIFFKGWTAMNEDLERHVEAADPREPVLDVLRRWYMERWPAFVNSDDWWGHERHRIIAETPALDAQRRHRLAKVERVIATAYGRELGVEPGEMLPRLLASATLASTMTISAYWYEKGLQAGIHSPSEVVGYAFALIEAGKGAVTSLDPPPF